ncbi:hypothetical protein PPL_02760 [Heterostelium album PN500]|uniref:Uncharacterized protein n=1 Tax=Heterostelium pallidum (strain ATCC 26659 / Pp 5 / PN500) TaxID=670386 RepID=D3B2Z5_HETP5|nr:hypothetical protein PPL_02760 [Heterostelium album PN500]EFA83693.1 hypothetical protein PPL_02760 [Heterostelium album PN500]|eukprot:XP_020435810.1 hypothetical protein PPL_02760 [Heterostelium album PN500]
MVKIVNGSIVDSQSWMESFSQKNVKPIESKSLNERIVKTLELEAKVYGMSLKLKYLLAVSLSSMILFGSIGLLSLLLIVYLGTIFSSHLENQNENNENNSNNSNIESLANDIQQSQQQQSQQQQIPPTQKIINEEQPTTPPYHIMHSPKNLRRSTPHIVTFSPNSGRRLGTSLDNIATLTNIKQQ